MREKHRRTLAGIIFTCGILIVLVGILLPWSGMDWKAHVRGKWEMGGLGLTLVLVGASQMHGSKNIEIFHAFIKYMSLSGLVASIALLFFGSWNRIIVLLLGVVLNGALVLNTWMAKNFKASSHLVLAILLLISFLAIIAWNFISTALVYFVRERGD